MLTIGVACRRSPARLEGATCPIGRITVTRATELIWWDQEARTLRFMRDLEGIVTIETTPRWGDFAVEYAALVAQTFDGIVGVADEILGEVGVAEPITERQLAFAWRELDDRAQIALENYEAAMRIKHLAWESALSGGSSGAGQSTSRS
jgi:hypothetical protein